jgi:2-polyprenyl-3-methyl-5-hydroxy-6-metoxy-1,4-benzoquinol methylase
MKLNARSTEPERMETDCVDYEDYRRCLSDLSRVNVVTMTHRPMLRWLARETRGLTGFSLLDVACGHGDALRGIRRWADRKGIAVRLGGIDLNPWAIEAAMEATPLEAGIGYLNGDVFALRAGEPFDFIINSQFTHHLDDAQIVRFIRWMEENAQRGWFIGDLHRHPIAYYGFGPLARAAGWHHFVRTDGRISIARAFVPADWRRLLRMAGLKEGEAAVTWHLPFRLCVSRRRISP